MLSVLGQSLIVENKPGAAGALATGQVERAVPDGYTILMNATEAYVHSILKSDYHLAVGGPDRSKVLPDVPTFEELGYKDFDFLCWIGLVGLVPGQAGRALPLVAFQDKIYQLAGEDR